MHQCEIYEEIGKGQCKKQPYNIYTIMGRESLLSYHYAVLYDHTFNEWNNLPKKEYEERQNEITDQSLDIRKLENYKPLKSVDILFRRVEMVVPIIKEAIRKGYAKPL